MRNILTWANQSPIGRHEILRASAGAVLGIALAGFISTRLAGDDAAPLLIPPMGATAVLLFAVPASPFAQPYAVIAGNFIAAVIGVACAHAIPIPLIAAALAVGGSVAGMGVLRCIHPPSGAVALVTVLGGPHVFASGLGFVAVPVLLNTLLLVAAALAYNRAMGRTYPHRAHPPVHTHPPGKPARLLRGDFEEAIADYGEPLAIGAEDLEKLFEELQGRAERAGESAR